MAAKIFWGNFWWYKWFKIHLVELNYCKKYFVTFGYRYTPSSEASNFMLSRSKTYFLTILYNQASQKRGKRGNQKWQNFWEVIWVLKLWFGLVIMFRWPLKNFCGHMETYRWYFSILGAFSLPLPPKRSKMVTFDY